MKKSLLIAALLALSGCANLKVEWAMAASYSSANAKPAPVEPAK